MRRDKVKTAATKKKSRREDKKNTGARALTRQRRSRQRKWLSCECAATVSIISLVMLG